VPDQSGWRVSGSNSVIIGNLNEGDYTIASFSLQKSGQGATGTAGARNMGATETTGIKPTMAEDTPIKLEILYTDSRGNRNTIEKEVNIDSSNIAGAISGAKAERMKAQQNPLTQIWTNGKWVLLGLIILSMLIVVRKKYKKEKLENSDYTYFKAIKDLLKFRSKSKKK
jgi:hypothetical protein